MNSDSDNNIRSQRVVFIGLLVNGGLAVIKLIAGMVGHSYALVADAVESLADVFGSLVVWGGLRISAQPADADHPYGHGKAEPLAGMIVALMLCVAGIGVAVEAIREILVPHYAPAAFTLWVLLAVIVIKELLFRGVHRVAKRVDSAAVLVDAWHHRSDAITSAAAAIGISIALVKGKGYEQADDWAALFASGVILFNAYRMLMTPMRELMDSLPPEIIAQVRSVATRVKDVKAVEKVFGRKSGMRYLVDMHLEVDPAMTVRRSHALAHDVKEKIQAAMPNVQDVLIHIEPHGGPVPVEEITQRR